MSSRKDWIWMPHPAHFIGSAKCQFHLATYLANGYIVSTVGEYWPERLVREIHAQIYDPQWHMENNHLKGDYYDHAYMQRFGYGEIGLERKYETMVFRAVPIEDHPEKGGGCCPYVIASGDNLDFAGYNDAKDAREGHLLLCEEWGRKRMPKDPAKVVTRADSMEALKKGTEALRKLNEEDICKED